MLKWQISISRMRLRIFDSSDVVVVVVRSGIDVVVVDGVGVVGVGVVGVGVVGVGVVGVGVVGVGVIVVVGGGGGVDFAVAIATEMAV